MYQVVHSLLSESDSTGNTPRFLDPAEAKAAATTIPLCLPGRQILPRCRISFSLAESRKDCCRRTGNWLRYCKIAASSTNFTPGQAATIGSNGIAVCRHFFRACGCMVFPPLFMPARSNITLVSSPRFPDRSTVGCCVIIRRY